MAYKIIGLASDVAVALIMARDSSRVPGRKDAGKTLLVEALYQRAFSTA